VAAPDPTAPVAATAAPLEAEATGVAAIAAVDCAAMVEYTV
jgi:hypothetical protein